MNARCCTSIPQYVWKACMATTSFSLQWKQCCVHWTHTVHLTFQSVTIPRSSTPVSSSTSLYFVTNFAFGEALRYKRVRFPMVSLEFFIDIILPAPLRPWGCKMRPMRSADNRITFMCRLSWNLGVSTSWNPQGLPRPVMRLLYLCCNVLFWCHAPCTVNAIWRQTLRRYLFWTMWTNIPLRCLITKWKHTLFYNNNNNTY